MLGCSQIKGVLPPRFAEGAAAVVARIEDGKWNTLEGDGDPAKPSLDGIRGAHLFGAVVDPQPVWRARRARMSWSVLLSTCPSVSTPVTFGGGMTIE